MTKTSAEERLCELEIELPALPQSVARYASAVRQGNMLYLSGQGPGSLVLGYKLGKLGVDLTVDEGYDHARLAGLALLSVIRAELGSLDRVRQVVKLFGMVNATPDFKAHPQVINGCSDLFHEVFGDEVGRHARSAVGMVSLPGGISVEVEAIIAFD